MLLDLEHPILLLQHHAELHIQRLILVGLLRVIRVLHELTLPRIVVSRIHVLFHEVGIQILQLEELTGQIDHRTHIAILVFQHHARHAVRF